VRAIYLSPDVTTNYQIEFGVPDEDALIAFLCDGREFSRDRVVAALARMRRPDKLF
jgi:hypothetical protein